MQSPTCTPAIFFRNGYAFSEIVYLGHIESRVQKMYGYQLDPAFIEYKLIDLEDRSRRNNLRVDGKI